MQNPPCVLTDDNYCERHKVYHHGRLKVLALDEGKLGQKYRALWDKMGNLKITQPIQRTQPKQEPKKPCNCRKTKS